MSDECRCCGGRCGGELLEITRREFIGQVATGAASLVLLGDLAWARPGAAATVSVPARAAERKAYPTVPPRVYRGRNLEAVGMPLGGIGTGSIWLDGQGRLAVWQIFNNLSEPRIPDSFFAVRARTGSGRPVVRVLQTAGERGLEPIESLDYEGGYPIARLAFHDKALPVRITMEAFNPLIPLDAASSSIPVALFRLTAHNPGREPAEVSLFATLQNAVGSRGAKGLEGVRFAGYGGNRNRVDRQANLVSVALEKAVDPVESGPVTVRGANGQRIDGPELLWLTNVTGMSVEISAALARIAADGGTILLDGVGKDFFTTVAAFRGPRPNLAAVGSVFEDFEKDNYDGWTITGDAFGPRPSRGTEHGQQPVTGFVGKGLVNTFRHGDKSQGTATSKPFEIGRRYIGFLVGGGKHAGKTCVNLKVEGKIVRTATGKNREALEPVSWDVADFKGKRAVIEIVDESTEGWGHINVDQIVFSDIPPEFLLREGTTMETAAKAMRFSMTGTDGGIVPTGHTTALSDVGPDGVAKAVGGPWQVGRYTRLIGFQNGENGYRALAKAPNGDPLIIAGPLGKGHVVMALAPGLPWAWGSALLEAHRGTPLELGQRLVPGGQGWGTMALAALDGSATALPAWSTGEELNDFFTSGQGAAPTAAAESPASNPGATVNAALGVPFTLGPGASRTVTFAIAWHFPNVQRFRHPGNLYAARWPDASGVVGYVAENLAGLWERTRLYHQTVYESNLPEEFIDAMTSQVAILRGPTCFWSEDGYFGGFEGSYGCCPLNCTHVWNYAQSHARLFPAVGQNMRISNFLIYLHPDGETSHREVSPIKAFIDGHCACIEAALREHQLSPDPRFLERIWPGVKKAVDWLIAAIDADRDGVPAGMQWNTYDTAVSGANTFIGSQYLAALKAGEEMARLMGDTESAGRWRLVREAGMQNQDARLWSGEYYIQIPDPAPARDYNTGCHADQLLGQWWAHMLNLGYLYPAEHVKAALAAVAKHNFRPNFVGFKQDPRRYIPDDEGGLLICTWPHGGRPKSFILYADEVWTGIEYAAAGAMVYEGLIDAARMIVRTARGRYDGRLREGLNSGPGGNPYNELECGKFYARAMASWSLLLASQGQILDGPAGRLGFKPNWQPDDHRSFFTAPEGWGLFVQHRGPGRQTQRIEVRHGQLRLSELVFALPAAAPATATLTIDGQPLPTTIQQHGTEVRLALRQPTVVAEGSAVEVVLQF